MKRLSILFATLLLTCTIGSPNSISTNTNYVKEKQIEILQSLLDGSTETQLANKLAEQMWGHYGNGEYKEDVIYELQKVAFNLEVSWEWLVYIIHSESRGKPWIQNPSKKCPATGILQWTPKVARVLGTSIHKLKKMSTVEQIPYIEKYFRYTAKVFNFNLADIQSYEDLYLSVFYPKAVETHDEYLISSKGRDAYDLNSVIDTHYGNNDGKLKVADFKLFANRALS